MSRVYYTRDAELDIDNIAEYTIARWGEEQCAKYLDLLERTCEVIVPQNVRYARAVPQRPTLLRWRCERHVIYFRNVRGGIEIVRILHERMLPLKHL
ncbi:MAG: type II toxin-antitoxin system RelE/ParE family toxin [Kofleriaceae bacterium]